MKYSIGLLVVVALVIIFSYPHFLPRSLLGRNYKTTDVTVGNVVVNADVSNTNALRTLGLSGRMSLGENKGMLFVFDTPTNGGFWMKDMNFSLDMIWADGGRIVSIEKSVSPNTYPTVFYPTSPTRFVLELPAGFCDAHNLKVGDFFSTGL
jgi:uncharacterized membrane protein (UPF0127 family)